MLSSVRDATQSDVEAIGRVAHASWTDTYRDIFEPAFIETFMAEHYAHDALASAVERAADRDDAHFLVAERDGVVIAFAQYGPGRRGPELFRIYAEPAQYGSGVGRALLGELHRRLAGRVDSYLVDVHSRNDRGREFYERNGFKVVGGGATPDCDLTMRRTVDPEPASD